MKAAHMKQKIVIPALVGMMMIPGSAVYAADQKAEVYPVLPAAGIETVVTDCYETKVKENLQLYQWLYDVSTVLKGFFLLYFDISRYIMSVYFLFINFFVTFYQIKYSFFKNPIDKLSKLYYSLNIATITIIVLKGEFTWLL